MLDNHPFRAPLVENINEGKTNWRKLMTMNPAPNQNQNIFSIFAIVLGSISFLFFWGIGLVATIIFGIPALILAIIAKSRKENLSKVALIISIVAVAFGVIATIAIALIFALPLVFGW